jgi:hypothetical protein
MPHVARKSVIRTTALAVVAVAGICGLGACTGSGAGSSGGVAGGESAGPQHAAANGVAPAPGRAPARAVSDSGITADVISTAKIRLAELTVAVKRSGSVPAAADRAESIAITAGGEVDADDRTSGKNATATLVLRVPPEELGTVLNQLAGLGKERSRHSTTQDVTAKVADVTSRVASAQASIARLRQLYQHASKVRDVIAIEDELAGRESNLEALQAEQRALAAQTSTARITLSLVRQAAPPPPPPTAAHHRSGFVGGLQNGWDAFRDGVGALATAAGAVLPFLVVVLILLAGGRLGWRRLRPSQTGPPPSSPS